MADMQLTITVEEQSFLKELLETTLKDAKIEEHRTRAPSYRQHILEREQVIVGLLNRLGRTT